MKRAVQRELETALAKGLLRGDFGEDDTVVVEAPGGAKADELTLTRQGGGDARPIVQDSLDLDVTADHISDADARSDSFASARQ